MLYDRWRKTAAEHARTIAFHEPGMAGAWTFERLARLALNDSGTRVFETVSMLQYCVDAVDVAVVELTR